jgi:phosphoglycolate phosphatase
MKIEAVIFDLDGTLIDTIEDIAAANNRMLKNNNFPEHDVAKYVSLIGEGAGKLVRGSLPPDIKPDEDRLQAYINEYSKNYSENLDVKSKIFNGIDGVLDYLIDKKIFISINTNKPHDQTLKIYNKYLKRWNFSFVIGHQDGHPHKPDPSGALNISNKLQIKPENILFIGDSAIDIITARAAGMIPIAVTWGYGDRVTLMNSNYFELFYNPAELLNFLKSQIDQI